MNTDYTDRSNDVMADERQRIEAFWTWFAAHKSEFSKLTLDDPFWDIALEELKKVDQNLWFELSRDDGTVREFIVTAEGQVSAFPIAEELVHRVPNMEGWVFIALKPAQGFKFTTTYEGTIYDPRQIWFLPLERESQPGDLGIRIGISGLGGMDENVTRAAF